MRSRLAAVVGVLALAVVVGTVQVAASLHEVTYKGTVASATEKAVKIKVVNVETEETTEMAFELDADTKILRGDDLVTFAQARIQTNESIAVTVNTDESETLAIVVRLTASR